MKSDEFLDTKTQTKMHKIQKCTWSGTIYIYIPSISIVILRIKLNQHISIEINGINDSIRNSNDFNCNPLILFNQIDVIQ